MTVPCLAVWVGFDLRSLAVPLDAEPVRRIRSDAQLWQVAVDHPPFATAPVSEPEITRHLRAVLPDAAWVHHFDDRSFTQAEYLLDPVAFRATSSWGERERSVPYRVVHGDEVFAAHAVSGQGLTWRCSRTAFLAEAAEWIDLVDADEVRREFSVADMARRGLYKVHPDEDDERALVRVLGGLRRFGDHCRAVADRGLDLIIELS